MNAMRMLLLFCLFVLSAGSGIAGEDSYAQSYAILIKGAVAGTESVTERIAENGDLIAVSEHDMLITDGIETKRMAFATRMVLQKDTLYPVSYSYKYTAGDSGDFYDVAVKDSQVTRTLQRGERKSEVMVPFKPDMVILDFSVYHQYDYLVRKYDARKGGRQVFSDFVPVVGDSIPVALTFQGNADLEAGKKTLPVRNYMIEFVGIWTGSVTTDLAGRLVRLVIPAQDLEVVRKDLLPQ